MTGRFSGKVAIVTGGSSGIGAATVERLAAEGAQVIVADVNAPADAASVHYLACDVTDPAAAAATIEETVRLYGRLDILINNAGVGYLAEAEDMPFDAWDRVFAINVNAVFYACRVAIPAMRASGGGAIVNVASISGLAGDYGFGAYSASKGAVVNFTRTLALDAARDHIRVNALCPGAVAQTAMGVGSHGSDADKQEWTDRIPLGRYGTPVEVASAIAFLASDEASYITGSVMVVDGGVTAHTGQPNIIAQRKRRLADAAAH
ncbi:SDR family NAD(P)-dependent oxidoreductase [Sphingomonas sp. BIUV-7]|uniref:SDR family NAD(P)-dependent oxidoreductase n=1 Tax=Sphingomonas natans TaxID=3063330 RepID=A0ABT8Y859_9SPHN|nr:SDR family NAD(P)-dependent oxidoreductase [Sphingomonas sp. BIUV-7]MDO6414504.1 SDR family NAD(P)-dependent oxidoreductase [Sphingomonas sp. BIUV-7]